MKKSKKNLFKRAGTGLLATLMLGSAVAFSGGVRANEFKKIKKGSYNGMEYKLKKRVDGDKSTFVLCVPFSRICQAEIREKLLIYIANACKTEPSLNGIYGSTVNIKKFKLWFHDESLFDEMIKFADKIWVGNLFPSKLSEKTPVPAAGSSEVPVLVASSSEVTSLPAAASK